MPLCSSLPPEIYTLIAAHLGLGDVYACVFVCKEWYQNFVPTLYTSLNVRQFRPDAYNSVRLSSPLLGPAVRELSIDEGVLTDGAIKSFGTVCPHITSLYFHWLYGISSRTSSRRLKNNIDPHYSSHSCIPLLKSIHATTQLQRLMLCCFGVTATDDIANSPSYKIEFLNQTLCHTPNLRSLSLIGVLPTLRATDLDVIHSHCPQLSELKLTGANALLTGGSADQGVDTGYPHMRRIALVYPSGWSRIADWLYGLSRRYPNLQVLDLEDSARGSIIPRTDNAVLEQAFSAFASQHCNSLEKVRLVHLNILCFQVYRSFLAPLSKLRDLTLHDRKSMDIGELLDTLSPPMSHNCNNSLVSLDTHQSSSRGPATVLSGRCIAFLTTLNIDMTNKDFHFENLLDSCNSIKELTITHGNLSFTATTPAIQCRASTTLNQLRLKRTRLPCNSITLILSHCPKLRSLELNVCGIYASDESREIRLNFSAAPILESVSLMNTSVNFNLKKKSKNQQWDHISIYAFSCGSTTLNIKAPARKKRRCDPHSENRRWYFIPYWQYNSNCTHFDVDPNEQLFVVNPVSMRELEAKQMEKVIGQKNEWHPERYPQILNDQHFPNSRPAGYMFISCGPKLKYLRINGRRLRKAC
ncbi:hypothetical protein BDB00DRAFT_825275 [Zychaea mexicana]|uniref:uncharacterized protein n=1 Tax=Zychaea mexicana TaxID=64656 RepID=UPI0022FE6241|nr:uncharacterized protein BDB00DRAFT_825275 [Zychaea mexicana]KAI9493062.1 hypothetical protein BDB00DRAFT_825275 [Zychaea mexicana]